LQSGATRYQQEAGRKQREHEEALSALQGQMTTSKDEHNHRDREVNGLKKEVETQGKLNEMLETQLREEQQRYIKHLQDYQRRIDEIFNEKLSLQTEMMGLREASFLAEAHLKYNFFFKLCYRLMFLLAANY